MARSSVPTDVAGTARADRARDELRARQFEEQKKSNLDIYFESYSRRWRFTGRVRGSFRSVRRVSGRRRRLVRYAAVTLLAAGIASPTLREAAAKWIVAATLHASEPVLRGGQYLDRLERRWRCALHRVLLDARGEFAGLLQTPECAAADRPRYRSTKVHPALAAELAAEVQLVEGQYHVGHDTILGWNWRGWARGAYGYITGDGSLGGGSSPVETAAKNNDDSAGQLGLIEKLKSGARTVALTTRLGSADQRDAFVLENTPCARGAVGSEFGAPVAGALCFEVFFGLTNPTNLSPAQRCVVAASYQRLALIAGPNSTAEDRAEARAHNAALIRRARDRCLSRGAWTAAERRAHEAELKRIGESFPFAVADAGNLEPADPALRGRARLAGAGFLVSDQLKVEPLPGGSAPVRLTLSAAVQSEAFGGFERTLVGLEPRLGGLCATDCKDSAAQVDAAVLIIELTGGSSSIVAGITTKHSIIGGRLQYVAGRGFEPMPPTRSVGSLNKPWLSWFIARAGISQLCNKYFQGVRNPGATEDKGVLDCGQPGAMKPVAAVFAQSLNLPFLAFAGELGADALRKLAESLGLTVKQGLAGDALLRGFVLGNDVVATPATLVRNFSALYRGGRGVPASASMPNLVSGSPAREALDLAQLGFDAKTLQGGARFLHAPAYHAGGTLRSLAPVLQRLGCERAVAKTGTSESATAPEERGNRDRMLLAAFRCGERDFSVFAMIGSPEITTSLGGITSADVVRLVQPVLAATLKNEGAQHASR